MSPIRYRDDDSSLGSVLASLTVGALAGFAVGVVMAQKVGGIAGVVSRVRDRVHGLREELFEGVDATDDLDDEGDLDTDDAAVAAEADDAAAALEERVLEAFRADTVLSERAVDIGAVGDGIVELSGWVNDADEAEHAVTVARGVGGVDTVVNRLSVGEDDAMRRENQARFAAGDDALHEARWEGQRVGTGRPRQGQSGDPYRHASPKVELESKWLDTAHALEAAAEPAEGGSGEERPPRDGEAGPRRSGAPEAPTHVPKGDHVAQPLEAERARKERERRAE